MDNTKIDLHLCAGYDGIGLGLKLAGVPEPSGRIFVEIESYPAFNLCKKIEEGELGPGVVYSDLKTFPYQEVVGHVRILSAGFPCQPFSGAGLRKGVDDPRHLWPHIARGISVCRPEYVFCENVEGIISSKTTEGQSVLQHVLESLERLGYRATAGIFSASEIGASHQRKRVYILGKLADPNSSGGREDKLPSELRASGSEQPPTTSRARSEQGEGKKVKAWMADTNDKRLSGRWRYGSGPSEELELHCYGEAFPARPGEDPRDWEDTRLKPKLGLPTDGYPHKLDQLRLLGNGVVPQTVARAWQVLNNRLGVAF